MLARLMATTRQAAFPVLELIGLIGHIQHLFSFTIGQLIS